MSLISNTNARIEFIDTLRGLAALSVVCGHYLIYNASPPFIISCCMATPLGFWFDGAAAVSFFFVLSGYILTYMVSHNSLDRFSFIKYTLLRVARIWVPYAFIWLVIAITY